MYNLRKIKIYLSLILLIGLMVFLASTAGAQFFSPFFNPMVPLSPYGLFAPPPAIRTAAALPGYLPPFMPPAIIPPAPIFRTAAATITLWLTVGTANSLLIYNPTALLGASAAPVTPSPLFSLIAGVLTAPTGHSALSTTNPAFYNYLVNTYLLPTGLAYFAIP